MALYRMTHKGAMLLGGGGIVLGGYLSSWKMASLIALSGFVGMFMFYSIIGRIEVRKIKTEVLHDTNVRVSV
ncbi:hypothetical protein D3C85_1808220 [compost metagenome]